MHSVPLFDVRPSPVQTVPAEHGAIVAGVSQKNPAGHGVSADAPAGQELPAVHVVAAVLPWGQNVPATVHGNMVPLPSQVKRSGHGQSLHGPRKSSMAMSLCAHDGPGAATNLNRVHCGTKPTTACCQTLPASPVRVQSGSHVVLSSLA